MSDYPMLISNKLHSFRNFLLQIYGIKREGELFSFSFYFPLPRRGEGRDG